VNPLDPTLLLLGVLTTTILFAVRAFFTRATPRRIAGALIAALPIIPLVMIYDAVAARLGWWHYPSVTTGRAPLAWYIAAAMLYGAAFGLVGWRVVRRFGRRGLIVFLIALALFGVARDVAYSLTTNVIEFGGGATPLIADLFAYGSAAALVQILMAWVVGPPGSDPLARQKTAPLWPDRAQCCAGAAAPNPARSTTS
jgi:hypothetical protein